MQDTDMGEKNSGDPSQRNGLLASNDLVYLLPPDLSVSVNQTHKNQYFQSTTYTNSERAVCILNTGADYGDMRNSTLDFGIQVTLGAATQALWFGRHGSILNVIRSITISSRSGDELSRIENSNLLNYTQNGYKYDKRWHETVGQMIGLNQTVMPVNVADAKFQTQRFSIPLYLLSDFFGYGRLMPPMVLSGLRVEIEWAPTAEIGVVFDAAVNGRDAAAGAVTSYTIDNPYISIRAVQLTDATQRALNEMSAVNGLELVYCDYERTDRSEATSTLHMEIRKAASRALSCIMTSRVTADTTDVQKDSLRSELWGIKRWQWQLGSLYFPQQPVYSNVATANGPAYKILAESYKHALICFDKLKASNNKTVATPLYKLADGFDNSSAVLTTPAASAVTTPYSSGSNSLSFAGLSENAADFDYGTFANGNGIVATTLERSDLFNLSGVPINNSRVLAIRAEYEGAAARTVTAFLKYVRLARVFMTNVEVEQ